MPEKSLLRKIWWFIWEDDSIWSWIVNIILAFVLIKFIVYPGLGWFLGTGFPIVAVVSESMEHNQDFDTWWDMHEAVYEKNGIAKQDFQDYKYTNGFNKGDIMVLRGTKPEDIEVGDVIVFRNHQPDPIIHRVVKRWIVDGSYHFRTKGDNNIDSIDKEYVNEMDIVEERLVGRAWFRIPLLGYIKIWAFELFSMVTGGA